MANIVKFSDDGFKQHKKVTLDAIGVSDVIKVPRHNERVNILVNPGASSSAVVQYTMSTPDEIIADSAEWFDWAAGAVAVQTEGLIDKPVVAVRLSVSAGTAVAYFVTD